MNYFKIYILGFVIFTGTIFFMTCEDTTAPEKMIIEDIKLSYSNSELFISAIINSEEVANIDSVTFTLLSRSSDEILEQGRLWDNGNNGDIIADNGEFTIQFETVLSKGEFKCLVEVMRNGSISDSTTKILQINPPPPTLSLLEKTQIFVDSAFAYYSMAVDDENGLNYIEGVYAQLFFPDNQGSGSVYAAWDDGNKSDQQAGDGIYTYAFVLPKPLPYYGIYKMKFWAINEAGKYSDTLTVDIKAPLIKLIKPNQGSYSTNQKIDIQWESTLVDSINIAYDDSYSQDAPEFETIADVAAGDGSYEWEIPAELNSETVKIRISSIEMPYIEDISDQYITITSN